MPPSAPPPSPTSRRNRYGYGERTLGVMPLYHTMGVRSLLSMALVSGGFVCQPRFETSGALDLIARHRVTNLYLVPTLLPRPARQPSVRIVERVERAQARIRGCADDRRPAAPALRRVSAPSCSSTTTARPRSTPSPSVPTLPPSRVRRARPASTSAFGVVRIGGEDPDDTMPPDEEGEIIASLESDESFTGYWRRPEADAKSLRAGWYFTGDVGYFDADGDLFVTGRVDDMMISGGENVMPVEIESVLSLHPGVAEVAVAGTSPTSGSDSASPLSSPARAEVDADTLDAYCKASALADFKRPRRLRVRALDTEVAGGEDPAAHAARGATTKRSSSAGQAARCAFAGSRLPEHVVSCQHRTDFRIAGRFGLTMGTHLR